MHFNILAVVPPLLTIILAYITQRMLFSLGSGILCAALVATHGSFLPAGSLIVQRGWGVVSDPQTALIFTFFYALGALVSLLTRTGGITAFAHLVTRKVTNARGAQTTSLILSLAFFIDDYLSGMAVGSIMRSLMDRFRVSRVKLGFLVNSIATPLALLIPFLSWAAFVGHQFEQAGIAHPLWLYWRLIPFFIFPWCMMLSAWIIVRQSLSFGYMHTLEVQTAQEPLSTTEIMGGDNSLEKRPHATLFEFLFPITLLLAQVFTGIVYYGHTHIAYVLCGATVSTVTISLIAALWRHTCTVPEISPLLSDAFELVYSTLAVLTLAWTFGALLNADVHTGEYLGTVLTSILSPVYMPVTVFIITTITTFAVGSSWGTYAILIPIVIPLLALLSGNTGSVSAETIPLLLPTLGALLAGGTAGNIISPIADAPIMASTSAGCSHIALVKAQLGYTIPALIGSLCAYSISGFMIQYGFFWCACSMLLTGILITTGLLYALNKFYRAS